MDFNDIMRSEEVLSILDKLFDKILIESQRGAVLIATSVIQECLKREVIKILPKLENKSESKNLNKLLLSFPGPLSSFSSIVLLTYSFGHIDRNLYQSLNTLRRIRNDAAHIDEDFNLNSDKYEEKFNEIFKLYDNTPYYIHNISVKALFDEKMILLKHIIDKNIEEENEKDEFYKNILNDKDRIDEIEKQKFHWILIYGTVFICAHIIHSFASKGISSSSN